MARPDAGSGLGPAEAAMAQLEAETWPNSRLTLTLYTLSLDAKWMKL